MELGGYHFQGWGSFCPSKTTFSVMTKWVWVPTSTRLPSWHPKPILETQQSKDTFRKRIGQAMTEKDFIFHRDTIIMGKIYTWIDFFPISFRFVLFNFESPLTGGDGKHYKLWKPWKVFIPSTSHCTWAHRVTASMEGVNTCKVLRTMSNI